MKKLGLYCGARNVQGLGAFETWLGQPLAHALDFTAGGSWAEIEDPNWWLRGWGGADQQVTFSIPMLPPDGSTLLRGANGDYNAHWAKFAANFVNEGFPDAVLRIGWELNGNWYPWFAGMDPPAFVGYWRQIVDTMRGVAPKLRFEWCPTLGRGHMGNPVAAYPGDRWVNRVGTDVYDSGPESTSEARWKTYVEQPFGLDWHADFAARHGKNMSHAEWGLWNRDNPFFIQKMYEWIVGHKVVSACYFNVVASADHRLTSFPNSQAKFKEVFG